MFRISRSMVSVSVGVAGVPPHPVCKTRGGGTWLGKRGPPRAARGGSLDLRFLVVAAVHQHLLPVRLVHQHRLEQVGGHDLHAVVVGLGVVDLGLLARQHRVHHVGRHLGEFTRVLEHGGGLLALQDGLDRRHLGVLAGHDRAGLLGGAVAHALERRKDADGDPVVRREHGIHLLLAVVGREQVVHAGLGRGAVPAQGADLVHPGLLAAHHQLAAVDVGLQHAHRAVIEEEGVVVVGRAAEELDIERALALLEAQLVHDGLRLQHADLEVVEGGVVIDVLRALDEAVVGDDLHALVRRALQHARERGAVDGGDHEHLRALGHHVLDLGELVGDVVFRVLQVGLVAALLEHLGHVVAVRDPAGRGLGGHGDADAALVRGMRQRQGAEGGEGEGGGGGFQKGSLHGSLLVFIGV